MIYTTVIRFLFCYIYMNSFETSSASPNLNDTSIYRGYNCSTTEFPFLVQVIQFYISSRWTKICEGTLINSNWVLTAAYCLRNSKDPFAIRHTDGRFMAVENIFPHTFYDRKQQINDIGLMKLEYHLRTRNTNINYVTIPKSVSEDIETRCPSGYIIEWGTNEANIKETFQCATLPVLSYQNCNVIYDKYHGRSIDSKQICTLAVQGADACNGDSGGPLMCRHWQIGIFSWGLGCGIPTAPTVYTRIAAHLDFINATMEGRSCGWFNVFSVATLVLQLLILITFNKM